MKLRRHQTRPSSVCRVPAMAVDEGDDPSPSRPVVDSTRLVRPLDGAVRQSVSPVPTHARPYVTVRSTPAQRPTRSDKSDYTLLFHINPPFPVASRKRARTHDEIVSDCTRTTGDLTARCLCFCSSRQLNLLECSRQQAAGFE